jgi:hypothetical protein
MTFGRNLFALLSSGGVGALGFSLLLSNRLTFVEPVLVIDIVAFIQWELFAVTAAKFGFDQVSYAIAAKTRTATVDLIYVSSRIVFPLALLFSIVAGTIGTASTGFFIFLSAMADAIAIIVMGDLNGRGDHLSVAKANLLNYPLFFAGLILLQVVVDASLQACLLLFAMSSWLRLIYVLQRRARTIQGMSIERPEASISLGLQQMSNYLLFRGDQLLISAIVFSALPSIWAVQEVSQYLFFSKFYDLATAVWVVVGVVLFREVFLAVPNKIGDQLCALINKHRALVAVGILSGTIGLSIYSALYEGPVFFWGAIPFCLMIALVFPVNLVVFSMIRANAFYVLLRNQCVALLFGIVMAGAIVWMQWSIWYVSLAVVGQLFLFVMLSAILPWEEPRPVAKRLSGL